MAKEFKDWDKRFTKAELQETRDSFLVGFDEIVHTVEWCEAALEDVLGYVAVSIEEARYAVYEAENYVAWQRFRVSMKGTSTCHKVYMLMQWHARYVMGEVHGDKKTTNMHRIWNYIGALKRGGQLVDEGDGLQIRK